MRGDNLKEYLPEFWRRYKEMDAIYSGEQGEVDKQWERIAGMWDGQFVETMPEEYLARWERMLQIPNATAFTLEERRRKIRIEFMDFRPYTFQNLSYVLEQLFGAGQYQLSVDGYTATIKLGIQQQKTYHDVVKKLRYIMPCNIQWKAIVMFNSHAVLKKYTHKQLAAYTHNELRKKGGL